MQELNSTETRMRSWRLRSPAAGLKRRILAAERAATNHLVPANAWLWGCLAPAMACVLLTLLAASHNAGGFGPKPGMNEVVSNQTDASYAAAGPQTARNHLAAVTFDSTNHSGIQTIIAFTPATNFSN